MGRNHNWFQYFLDECCELDASYVAKSGQVYNAYRAFCSRTGAFPKSTTDFYGQLDSKGFKRKRTNKGVFIKGLKLKP